MLGFTFLSALSLFGFGLLIGAVSPAFGIGGGLLTVPILILVYKLDSNIATATSLGIIIFTALSGTIAHFREKRVDLRIAFIFIIFAVPGSICGGIMSRWLKTQNTNIDILQIGFAVVMILISLFKIVSIPCKKHNDRDAVNSGRPLLERSLTDRHGTEFHYKIKLFPGILIAFAGGFLGAALGLGGGIIYFPVLTIVLGMPALIAAATSTFTILIATPVAAFLRVSSIQWNYVLFLALGTVVSAGVVPKFLHKIKSEWILTGFWFIAIAAAVRLLLNVFGFLI